MSAKENKQPGPPVYQLAAFEIMKGVLGKSQKTEYGSTADPSDESQNSLISEVCFQDPAMNELDREFLELRGYRIIEHPQVFDLISPRTFLYAPHAVFSHIRDILKHSHPALYVGNDLKAYKDLIRPNENDSPAERKFLELHFDEYNEICTDLEPFVSLTECSQDLSIMEGSTLTAHWTKGKLGERIYLAR
ncbi:MAG: hypothetical protein Q9201_006305 [Fulgogasparrea decipioides]